MVRLAFLWMIALTNVVWADITIFAATSMRPALDALLSDRSDVVVSYAGSSTLARQIAYGAEADIFISANPAWSDYIDDTLDVVARKPFLSNGLVFVTHRDQGVTLSNPTGQDLVSLVRDEIIATGVLDAVPLGIYAGQVLDALDLRRPWIGQIAQADNARAALMLVETGAAPWGILYESDIKDSAVVNVVWEIPDTLHQKIRYDAVLLTDAPLAAEFFELLSSDLAQSVFETYGFKSFTKE